MPMKIIEVMATTLLASLAFLPSTIAIIEYRSKMFTQRLSYFENAHIGMDVKFYGDEGYPYLTLFDEITPYNDLHLMLYVKNFDKQPVLLSLTPLSLCQLLYDTGVAKNKAFMSSSMAQFNLEQIFNFNGKLCPIEQSTIRLSPYIFPANFTFDESLGCGYKNLEAHLLKCDEELTDEGIRNCETLVKNALYVSVENDDCQNNSSDMPESQNTWFFDKVLNFVNWFR